jgi:metallo-beta-lactamase family protein
MNLQFIGATETVTGSKYLLSGQTTQLLVDCGLFQGLKQLRLRNRDALPFNSASIYAVVLTHAHIDHTGYIPLLVKQGFRGKIYCSHGTAELCRILLPDSGFLQEEDAHFANKHGFSKHTPALPLYTKKEAEASLRYLHPIDFDQEVSLPEGIAFTLLPAGHILGASLVKFTQGKTTLVFTGDLGRPHDLIMNPPTFIRETDYLVMESTYGDKIHETIDPKNELEEVINKTSHRGGVVVIPAFAVGRAQAIVYLISRLKDEKKIPDIPVYLDSPMAQSVTHLYCNFTSELRLPKEDCALIDRGVHFINTPEESKELDFSRTPKIIISASGMATGGRVVHHLKSFLVDEKNTIFFVGFQAAGTRGEALIHGAQQVKIHGEYIPVRAEIVLSDTLSAHADSKEILEWLSHFIKAPKHVFLTHGELKQAEALRLKIQEKFGWNCTVPHYLEKTMLDE